MIRRVSIEKLAPTGEGVARTAEGVGFVEGALPGETVEAEVLQEKKRFWFGRAVSILTPSPDRCAGPHTGCAGCDWSHLSSGAARRVKPELFLETMERIGGLDRALFGDLPIVPSPAAYRIRSRFHVEGEAATTVVGFHAPRSHRVAAAQACEALTLEMRKALPELERRLGDAGVSTEEIATLETPDAARRIASVRLRGQPPALQAQGLAAALGELFEGVRVRDARGTLQGRHGADRLAISIEGRVFEVSADSFFQVNRHLAPRLSSDVRAEAKQVRGGLALDAYGGVGFMAGALLDAGHRVVSVEESALSADDARRSRKAWGAGQTWRIEASAIGRFLAAGPESFDLVVADPPRAGLGMGLARELATRTRERFLYVSCEPATLARDLAVLLDAGFGIARARLYDLFAFTHRVEAMVTLTRRRAS